MARGGDVLAEGVGQDEFFQGMAHPGGGQQEAGRPVGTSGRFRFEVIPGQFCEGQYVIIDRPVRLLLTWGWTDPGFGLPRGTSRVEVTFIRSGEDGQQTRLRLVHSGLAGDLGLLHDDGWSASWPGWPP